MNTSDLLIVTGLACDIIGAVLVSSEVVNRFSGKLVEQSRKLEDLDYSKPVVTEGYSKWEANKYEKMKWGLGALIVGFGLQIAAVFAK